MRNDLPNILYMVFTKYHLRLLIAYIHIVDIVYYSSSSLQNIVVF